VRLGVHRRPRTTLGLLLPDAAAFVPFLDVLSLAFLLVCVRALVASWHLPSLLIVKIRRAKTWTNSDRRLRADSGAGRRVSCAPLTVPSTVVILSQFQNAA
jgi:hypothetical protein